MVGNKEKIEELFATWLAQNAPSAHLSELYFCYSEIEAYCLKIKVLRKPLFETIGVPQEYAEGTIRVSFGRDNNVEDASEVAKAIISVISSK